MNMNGYHGGGRVRNWMERNGSVCLRNDDDECCGHHQSGARRQEEVVWVARNGLAGSRRYRLVGMVCVKERVCACVYRGRGGKG
jgi:hypothetical protein